MAGWLAPAIMGAIALGSSAMSAFGSKGEEQELPDEVKEGMKVLNRALKKASKRSGQAMPVTLGNNFMMAPTGRAKMYAGMMPGLAAALMGAPIPQTGVPWTAQMAPFLQAVLGNQQLFGTLNSLFSQPGIGSNLGSTGLGNASTPLYGSPY